MAINNYITATYSALALLVLHLGRLVQDLQVWTSFEVAQIYVPNSFVQISSIMPQKRNPVPIEHLRLLGSLAMGQADAMIKIMHNTPFTDMNDSEGEVQTAGYTAFANGRRMVDLLAALIPHLSVRHDRVRANIDLSSITVTELADTLVRAEDLPFRQAHEIAADVARGVVARGAALSEGFDLFKHAFLATVGHGSRLTAEQYRLAVSAENFVAIRNRVGGPAPEAMDESLAVYRDELDALTANAAADAQRAQQAHAALDSSFRRLAGSPQHQEA